MSLDRPDSRKTLAESVAESAGCSTALSTLRRGRKLRVVAPGVRSAYGAFIQPGEMGAVESAASGGGLVELAVIGSTPTRGDGAIDVVAGITPQAAAELGLADGTDAGASPLDGQHGSRLRQGPGGLPSPTRSRDGLSGC